MSLQPIPTRAAQAGADLTGKLYCFVKIAPTGKYIVCGAGDHADAVLCSENTLDGSISLSVGDFALVRVPASPAHDLVPSDQVVSDSNGHAIRHDDGSSGDVINGTVWIGPTEIAAGFKIVLVRLQYLGIS